MTAARTLQTIDDLHPDDRAELIDGAVVQKTAPLLKHGMAQARVAGWASTHFHGGPPDTSGWWFGVEVHVQIASGRVVCPDVAGWRTEPLRIVPEWICEIVSVSNASHDLEIKVGLYAEARVEHYWLLDPTARRLMVYRWTEQGYLVVCNASGDETVRAEPFEAVAVQVAQLLGD